MIPDTALVIIDVQKGLIDEAYRRDEVLEHINTLLAKARASGTPVIYVQHDGPKGKGARILPTGRISCEAMRATAGSEAF